MARELEKELLLARECKGNLLQCFFLFLSLSFSKFLCPAPRIVSVAELLSSGRGTYKTPLPGQENQEKQSCGSEYKWNPHYFFTIFLLFCPKGSCVWQKDTTAGQLKLQKKSQLSRQRTDNKERPFGRGQDERNEEANLPIMYMNQQKSSTSPECVHGFDIMQHRKGFQIGKKK